MLIKLKIFNCRDADGNLIPNIAFDFKIDTYSEASESTIKAFLADDVYQIVLDTKSPQTLFVDNATIEQLKQDGYNCDNVPPSKGFFDDKNLPNKFIVIAEKRAFLSFPIDNKNLNDPKFLQDTNSVNSFKSSLQQLNSALNDDVRKSSFFLLLFIISNFIIFLSFNNPTCRRILTNLRLTLKAHLSSEMPLQNLFGPALRISNRLKREKAV